MLLRSSMLVFKPSRVQLLLKGSPSVQRTRNLGTHAIHASSSLPKRALGSTGYDVFPLGLGASPLGAAYGDISEDTAIATVHEAFNQGINYFDTSPFYGDGLSEIRLGKGLKDLPRDQVVLGTKVGRYGPNAFANLFDFSAERIQEGFKESCERLQVDYIDVYQCHDIEFRDLEQIVGETLPALMQLKQEGKIRAIGITGLPLPIFKKILDRVEAGTVDTILSYCHNSLNDTSLLDLVPYLHQKGVGIISASPMTMGLLTTKGPAPWHPAPQELKETGMKAAKYAEEQGVPLPRLALKHSLQSPDVAVTLLGMSSPDEVVASLGCLPPREESDLPSANRYLTVTAMLQVKQNVQAAKEALGLAQAQDESKEETVLREVQSILKPIKNQTWPSGRPENSQE